MATYKPSYASTSDLRDIYPNIDKYDTKRQVLGITLGLVDWYSSTLDIYYATNTGIVNQLFLDGVKIKEITFNTTETTKLDGAMTSSAALFYADASHGLEGNDIVKIDDEYIRVTGVASDTINCSTQATNRGLFGTAAQHHANDASVYKIIDASVDLGDAASADPDALSFVYDKYHDMVLLVVTTSPVDSLLEAGEDWNLHQTDMLYKASRYFDSYVDPSLPTQMWKNDDGEYDYIVIRTTAQICAYFLLSAHDPENEDALKIREEYESILDRINAGGIKLGFEKSSDSSKGIIRELYVDSASTLKPVDLRGVYTGGVYDKIRVGIIVGGTIADARYSVWVAGDDNSDNKQKLGINKGYATIVADTITGEYQELGGGLEIRFGAATTTGISGSSIDLMTAEATANDVYEVEVWGVGEEMDDARGIKSAYMTRS